MTHAKIGYSKNDVTQDDVDAVEDDVGMGCGAWDMVNPREIIAAAWNRILTSVAIKQTWTASGGRLRNSTCFTCQGTGSDHVERQGSRIINAPCDTCRGSGRLREWRGADVPSNPTMRTVYCLECCGTGVSPESNCK